MDDKEALKKIMELCFINFDNEIEFGIRVSIDKVDPILAKYLAQYLSDDDKKEYTENNP